MKMGEREKKKGKCKEESEETRKERGSVEKLITGVGSGWAMRRGTAKGWVDKLKRRVDEETQVKRVWCAGTDGAAGWRRGGRNEIEDILP
jgi:hypothetical protein